MLTSLALIFLTGMLFAAIVSRLRLPGLLGMLLAGILLGPGVLDLLSPDLLAISADLRRLALVIILTRAGLTLQLSDLRRAGRPAVLLCFLPACAEILGVVLLAPLLLGVNRLDAAIIGSILAAVSPAVIVPRMIRLIETRRGTEKGIPQMLLVGASVDDVLVIVLFTAFTGLAAGEGVSAWAFLQVPISLITGIAGGILVGLGLGQLFRRFHLRDSAKVVLLLSISLLLLELEDRLSGILPFSGLLAIMAAGAALNRSYQPLAMRLSAKYNKIWVAAELALFVLVGAAVDPAYALKAGAGVAVLVALALLFRMGGVWLSVAGTRLTRKERLFAMLAYTPKATVQAAIGSVPLAMGLSCGSLALTTAVVAILLTAPFGAIAIDLTAGKLLTQEAKAAPETASA